MEWYRALPREEVRTKRDTPQRTRSRRMSFGKPQRQADQRPLLSQLRENRQRIRRQKQDEDERRAALEAKRRRLKHEEKRRRDAAEQAALRRAYLEECLVIKERKHLLSRLDYAESEIARIEGRKFFTVGLLVLSALLLCAAYLTHLGLVIVGPKGLAGNVILLSVLVIVPLTIATVSEVMPFFSKRKDLRQANEKIDDCRTNLELLDQQKYIIENRPLGAMLKILDIQ